MILPVDKRIDEDVEWDAPDLQLIKRAAPDRGVVACSSPEDVLSEAKAFKALVRARIAQP